MSERFFRSFFFSGPSCSSSSSLFPCDSCATTQPFISNTSRVARAPTGTRFSKFESYSGGFGLTSENSSSLFDAKQVGSSNSDIEKRFSEKRDEGLEINEKKKSEFSSADEIYDSMSNLPHSDFARPSKTSSALVKESSLVSTFKSGHPALVRTDSRSAQSLFSTSGGAHTSHPVPKVLEHKNEPRSEEQKTVPTVNESDGGPRTEQISGEAKTMNVLGRKNIRDASSGVLGINPPENFTHFEKRFCQGTGAIIVLGKLWLEKKARSSNSIPHYHNSVRADLKYTINERTAVWTKKYAKEDEIKQAARFFTDLLSGITVFGFRGKHINLKGEDDARGWAFAHIVSAYINLVVQDLSLVDVAAAVLSRVAFQWEEFTSFLFGKLCASSLLLSMQFHRCEEKMVELSKRGEEASEAAAAWGARENALVRLFAAIHADRTVNEVDRQGQQCPFTGAPLLWLLAVATLKQRSPFAAALLSGLLTVSSLPLQSGWVLRESYKKQFDKLLAVIGEKVIPAWGKTLEATPVSDVVCSCQRMWVASLKDSYDRGDTLALTFIQLNVPIAHRCERRLEYTMKLMTHNFLTSKFLKGVVTGYPLLLVATKKEVCLHFLRFYKSGHSEVTELKLQGKLMIIISSVNVKEFEFNAEFVKRMIPKLDYPVLRQAAESIGEADGLPAEISTGWEDNEILLKKLHHVLVSVEVLEGELKCPETGRVFPIREGIPNMLVRENEVD
ncbi:unnamed protein product [Toxocara canis]|uniref:Multifunctional methyltransferase subunit TRM112-like protein n=1 Tax=Toxocara canis TaxID=6265 RepID=A0A3P7FYL1_TOXCA|nr:unnamed protein product [Toxocara canis]